MDIPGVGSRIRNKLVEHFGSEDDALKIILQGDVASLRNILNEKQALFLIQWMQGSKYNSNPSNFLANEEAIRIYEKIISKMREYAHTEYARLKIGTIFPSSSRELIEENRKIAEPSIAYAKILGGSGIDELIGRIMPMREKSKERIRDRAIVIQDLRTFEQIKSRGLDKLIDIYIIESQKELIDLARSYSHICLVGNYDCPKNVELAECLDDWYLVPEKILEYYRGNSETLISAMDAASILADKGIIYFTSLQDFQGLVQRLESHDKELETLARQLAKLNQCFEDAESWANSELKNRIEASSITLVGHDLLQALRGKGMKDLFEIQLSWIFQAVLKDARSRAASCLELTGSEIVWLDEIIPSEIQYPFEFNRSALRKFEQELRIHFETRKLNVNRELARRFTDKKDFVDKIIYSLFEFDFVYAIGKFAIDEGLVMPSIVDETCLGFHEGTNLFIEDAEPVDYSLGNTGLVEIKERVAILSGVNSGGKTSLLDLLAQVTILGHMGLPVPAKQCLLGIFQEIYYFSKSKSTLSTGAFEAAMMKFALVANNHRKLVLADELEAITEPGASARIIACMLDELNLVGSAAVFVSHLAGEIKSFTETSVRIDGIEAEGLDEKNRLIVSRSPRYNFLARSTPELILGKLIRTTSGTEKEFYSRLLARFK
ncbi:MAG: DNA mismatch repair protein MutS [Methanotrichaceae archaeon]|nr:DNA mismatch repair protein MutS [Methanotrichaceae archaeon]